MYIKYAGLTSANDKLIVNILQFYHSLTSKHTYNRSEFILPIKSNILPLLHNQSHRFNRINLLMALPDVCKSCEIVSVIAQVGHLIKVQQIWIG
jgi:hypothetical protein